jgi:hypothetical protein
MTVLDKALVILEEGAVADTQVEDLRDFGIVSLENRWLSP